MKDDLVKLVSDKVGITEQQASQAVDVVMDYLGERLPEPIAGQLDAALKGGGADLGGMASGLGGFLKK
jgi:hypothetical protein